MSAVSNPFQPSQWTIAPSRFSPRQGRPTRMAFRRRIHQAVLLYHRGFTYLDIAHNLAADPTVNPTGVPFDGGYGWEQHLAGQRPPTDAKFKRMVQADIDRVQRAITMALHDESQRQFIRSLGLCDFVVKNAYGPVQNGSHWHMLRILQAEEHRAKLWKWGSDPYETKDDPELGAAAGLAPGAQPEYTLDFMSDVFDALVEAGIVESDEAAQVVAAVTPDADVIDVPAEEVPVVDD